MASPTFRRKNTQAAIPPPKRQPIRAKARVPITIKRKVFVLGSLGCATWVGLDDRAWAGSATAPAAGRVSSCTSERWNSAPSLTVASCAGAAAGFCGGSAITQRWPSYTSQRPLRPLIIQRRPMSSTTRNVATSDRKLSSDRSPCRSFVSSSWYLFSASEKCMRSPSHSYLGRAAEIIA